MHLQAARLLKAVCGLPSYMAEKMKTHVIQRVKEGIKTAVNVTKDVNYNHFNEYCFNIQVIIGDIVRS